MLSLLLRRVRKTLLLLAPLLIIYTSLVLPCYAMISLPHVFGNGMVLQREQSVAIWGKAARHERVTLEIGGQKYDTQADSQGKWNIKLSPHEAGGPFIIKISGTNTVVLKDVYFGDVWLCVGQSNMAVPLKKIDNARTELSAANYPRIRFLTVPEQGMEAPVDDFEAKWQKCTPVTTQELSAIAYFFGRNLHESLKTPIGLVVMASNGSTCEAWTERRAIQDIQNLNVLTLPERDAKIAVCQRTGWLFNGMLAPIVPLTIKGAIWYQGESNTNRAHQYCMLFPAMIRNWRDRFQQVELPFYFVQLPNFMRIKEQPSSSAWAELREAQHKTACSMSNVEEVVTIDIGDANNLQPQNKETVANRLASLALSQTYNQEISWRGPECRTSEIKGSKVYLTFDNAEKGLCAVSNSQCDDSELLGFSIAGEDRKFYWANASIEGDQVVVSSPNVPTPVAVRYAWADNPVCNLGNSEGFPASPFRTDDWPGVTVRGQ